MKATSVLQMVIRIIGVIELVLGFVFWLGYAESLIIVHILLGSLLTLALFGLVFQAYRAGIARWLVAVSAVWAIGLPLWGLAQGRIFPEAYIMIAQILHVLCAIGAIGLAEILGAQIRKKSI